MKNIGKILVVILVPMMLLAACGDKSSEQLQIGVIQYVDHAALDAARDGFVEALADQGYVDGENVLIDLQNAQADQSNLATITDRFVGNEVDLILAIATPAAQSVAGATSDIPILGTAITDYVVARLVDSNEAPGGNVTGTTDMNPIAQQIDLLLEFAPEAKTIGVLYTSSEDNSILQASMAKEAVEGKGLSYVEATVTNSSDVQQATQSIVTQCDAIYIPTDNVFASAMAVVEGVAIESKTPVVCGEAGMVLAGGLATLGINYHDLGYQTGEMAVRILEGQDPADMPIESANDFDYVVNKRMVEALGIEVPEAYQEYIQ